MRSYKKKGGPPELPPILGNLTDEMIAEDMERLSKMSDEERAKLRSVPDDWDPLGIYQEEVAEHLREFEWL